jgi:uncharacterized protein YjiS (DUF1127 family)
VRFANGHQVGLEGRGGMRRPPDSSLHRIEKDFPMTTIDLPRRTGSAPGSAFTDLLGTLRAWNDRRVTQNLLGDLTDRQLEDIGLTRAAVARGDLTRR